MLFSEYARLLGAQAFRPARGRAGSPEGLRYRVFIERIQQESLK
jgi:hypothetical protein